jgi:hypothetical protein
VAGILTDEDLVSGRPITEEILNRWAWKHRCLIIAADILADENNFREDGETASDGLYDLEGIAHALSSSMNLLADVLTADTISRIYHNETQGPAE